MPLSPNMRGALFMTVSMAGFTFNDAITKAASETMNMGQVMFVRGIFATLFIGAIAWHQGALARPAVALQRHVVIRVLGEVFSTVSFLVALAHLPLADISAVMQALPLAVAMGAAVFFNEKVGWRRWLAILVGFLGVLIVVRPGVEGFSVYSLMVVLCVTFCAIRDLATKGIPAEVPTLLVSTVTAAAVCVMGLFLMHPLGGWSTPPVLETSLLAVAALLLVVGYHFIILSMRVGDISFIAPFRYSSLVWAIALGFFIFGDIPDGAMIIGATLVVASGLYTLYRERVVGRHRPAAESTSPAMAPDGL